VSVAATDDVTVLVVTVKVAVVFPAATVTEAGTVAAALLLESATDRPPERAALLKVTVPVAAAPPMTLAGLTASEGRETPGAMVRAAL
jgi:hypothetical protein